MGRDPASQAELFKLARALGTTPDGVAFAESLSHDDLRRLRERVVESLYDEHRAVFRRVAMITTLLPAPLNVRITLRAFSPLLAARVAGEMTPDRAAELANRMPVEYLAESCLHLDPRRAAPLVSRINPDRAVAVVLELVERAEYIALGRLLDAATERIIRDVAERISDEALLRIGFYAESGERLTWAVRALPEHRLRGVVTTAMTGPPDLRSAGLVLIGRLTDDGLRGRLAEYAAECDDETLTTMLRTAVTDDALPELLTAVAAMGEPARRRVTALPALADDTNFTPLIRAAAKHALRDQLTPLADYLPPDLRRRLTAELGCA